MVTRTEFAAFIRASVAGSSRPEEWKRLAVAHYADPKIEHARRELVRESIRQNSLSPDSSAHLLKIAEQLLNEN